MSTQTDHQHRAPLDGHAAPGDTPLAPIALHVDGAWRRVGLKLESRNAAGSIKERTAYSLIRSLEESDGLREGDRLVESTSGNLGVALALICEQRDYRFTAVVDPKADPAVLERMRSAGAEVVVVDEPDEAGGYLLTRLELVRRMVAEQDVHWTNQYANPANPEIHYRQTAPEIAAQEPEIDAIFVATSTGGTLAGIGRFFKEALPDVRVIGVDVPGSRVFATEQAPRVLNGIGSSRASQFLRPSDYDGVVIVDDRDAVAACHTLDASLGIGLGGSSGATVVACARYLADHPELRRPACVCPDGRENYEHSIYDDGWLAEHAFRPASDARELPFDDARRTG